VFANSVTLAGFRPGMSSSASYAELDNLQTLAAETRPLIQRADSAGRIGIVLPALPAWFCGSAGVGSGAWVPA
jgi:hypothetical protein